MKKVFMLIITVIVVTLGCGKKDDMNSKDKKVDAIKLTDSDIELIIGETQYLNVAHYPENLERPNYTWSSSNEDIAIVDTDGAVTALKKGEVKITVSLSKSNLKDEVLVKIIPPASEKLELIASEKELSIGKTLKLTYRVLPEQAEIIEPSDLEWETSDAEKATVSNGIVTGIDEGLEQISAKIKGTGIIGYYTLNIKHIRITELNFEPVSGKELESGYSYAIKNITYLPSDATDTVFTFSYSKNNQDVMFYDSFKIEPHLTEGTVRVTVGTLSGVTKTNYYNIIPTKPTSMRVLPLQDTIEVLKGYTFDMNVQMQPTFLTDKIVRYSSDSPDIVQLTKEYHVLTNRGVALKAGKAIITMTPRTTHGSNVSAKRVIHVKELEEFISGSITKKELSEENGVYSGKLTFNFTNNYGSDIVINGATMVHVKDYESHVGIAVLGHRIKPNQNFSFEIEIKKRARYRRTKEDIFSNSNIFSI